MINQSYETNIDNKLPYLEWYNSTMTDNCHYNGGESERQAGRGGLQQEKPAGNKAMEILTYQELVVRYGKNLAFDLLLSIEKVAKTRDETGHFDEEARLQRALAALDSQSYPAENTERQRLTQ